MRYADVDVSGTEAKVEIELEANYTESPAGGAPTSYWAAESWSFTRKAGARSRPPDRVRVFSCPSCGAPLDRLVGGTCGYCQAVVDSGAFDWVVSGIAVLGRECPPMLTGDRARQRAADASMRLDSGWRRCAADPARPALFARRAGLLDNEVAWSSLAGRLPSYLSDNPGPRRPIDRRLPALGLRNMMDGPASAGSAGRA
jgi:hypothetical protein